MSESGGWDWEEIAASDYPVVTEPRWLRRDVVYCEFWAPASEGGAYSHLTGLAIPWNEWVELWGSGSPLNYDLEGVSLSPFTRARFNVWAAPRNPRWPLESIALWSLEGGFS